MKGVLRAQGQPIPDDATLQQRVGEVFLSAPKRFTRPLQVRAEATNAADDWDAMEEQDRSALEELDAAEREQVTSRGEPRWTNTRLTIGAGTICRRHQRRHHGDSADHGELYRDDLQHLRERGVPRRSASTYSNAHAYCGATAITCNRAGITPRHIHAQVQTNA